MGARLTSPTWPPRQSPRSRCTRLAAPRRPRSEEHTSELQSRQYLVCRLLLEKKKKKKNKNDTSIYHDRMCFVKKCHMQQSRSDTRRDQRDVYGIPSADMLSTR